MQHLCNFKICITATAFVSTIEMKGITRCKLTLIFESANHRKFLVQIVSYPASLLTSNYIIWLEGYVYIWLFTFMKVYFNVTQYYQKMYKMRKLNSLQDNSVTLSYCHFSNDFKKLKLRLTAFNYNFVLYIYYSIIRNFKTIVELHF